MHRPHHPLTGYGDMFSDMLSAASSAGRQGVSAAEAELATKMLAQPDIAQAAHDTGVRASVDALSQQLLQQSASAQALIAKNKTYFMIGGAVVASLIAYKVFKK